jgi:uncharacterized membrane protein
MNNNKGMKYYLIIFIVSLISVILYGIYVSVQQSDFDPAYFASLLTVPFAFTGFLMLFDFLLAKILPKKNPQKSLNEYEQYLIQLTEILKDSNEFSIEDFRKFRVNERFQRALKNLYKISKDGESEDLNYKIVEKRFKKDSLEHKAIQILINK